MHAVVKQAGRHYFFYYASFVEPARLMKGMLQSPPIAGQGRGGIRIFEAGGLKLVARKYMHGGLFRVLTGDLFLRRERATNEAEILVYLGERGIPVVAPFCAIIERLFIFKRLYLITVLEEGSITLLEYLEHSGRKRRLRAIRNLATLVWELERAGVYHPDLHLGNVLVQRDGSLIFLDFDRARRKPMHATDVESMLLRLGRFVGKMERHGRLSLKEDEKALFFRAYARLSGQDLMKRLEAAMKTKRFLHRIGWFVESVVYRGNR